MNLAIGQEVSVRDKNGIIRFIGPTKFAKGTWIGIELDVPAGKNNGTKDGVEYFKCKGENYGIFVPPNLVSERGTMKSPEHSHDPQYVINRLQGKLQDTIKEIKLQKSKIESLNEKIQLLEDTNSSLESSLEQETVNSNYQREENESLLEQLNKLRHSYDVTSKELESAHEEIEINKEIEREINLQIETASIEDKNHDIQNLLFKNKKLEVVLEDLKRISQKNELEMDQKIKDLEAMLQTGTVSTEKFESISMKLDQADKTIEGLRNRLESTNDLDAVIDRVTNENELLNTQIEKLSHQLNELMQIQDLDKDLESHHRQVEEDLRKEINLLQEKLKLETTTNDLLKSQIIELKERIVKFENKSSSLSGDELIRLKKLLSNCQLELKQKQHEYSSLEFFTSISNARLDCYYQLVLEFDLPDLYINVRLSAASLIPIRDKILKYSQNVLSFTAKYRLSTLVASITFITSSLNVVLATHKHHNSIELSPIFLGITTVFESLLEEIKNDTIQNYELNKVESFMDLLINKIISSENDALYNETGLFFCHWEASIVQIFLDFVLSVSSDAEDLVKTKSFVLELKSKFHELGETTSNRLNLLKENKMITAKYSINFKAKTQTKLFKYIQPTDLEFQVHDLQGQFQNPDFANLLQDLQKLYDDYLFELAKEVIELQIEEAETVPLARTTSNHDLADLIESKEKIIKDLELTLKLLENNMSTMSLSHKSKIDRSLLDFNELKSQYEQLQSEHNNLGVKNSNLEKEVEEILSSGKYFSLEYLRDRFNTTSSERSYVDSISLVEENNFLREIIGQKGESEMNDLGWLNDPIVVTEPPRSSPPNLKSISSQLQAISKSCDVLDITSFKEKRLKRSDNPKLIYASINEHLASYQNERDQVFVP